VEGVELLTETEKVTLRANKLAILQALRQPVEPINDHQGETVSRAPRIKADPGVMATGVKYGGYAPNCNRCRRYNWRSEICQRQGRLEFANTPPCQGRYYQPFALTLAEREAPARFVLLRDDHQRLCIRRVLGSRQLVLSQRSERRGPFVLRESSG